MLENFQMWDVLRPQSCFSSCQCTSHAGREMLGLMDDSSGGEYLHDSSSRAELHLGISCALPGWRETGRFREPLHQGSLACDLVKNLQMCQSCVGEEPVRLSPPELQDYLLIALLRGWLGRKAVRFLTLPVWNGHISVECSDFKKCFSLVKQLMKLSDGCSCTFWLSGKKLYPLLADLACGRWLVVFAVGTKCSLSWSYLTKIRSLESGNVDVSKFADNRRSKAAGDVRRNNKQCVSLSLFSYKHQSLVFSPHLFWLPNCKLLHLFTFLWVTFLPLSPVAGAGWWLFLR